MDDVTAGRHASGLRSIAEALCRPEDARASAQHAFPTVCSRQPPSCVGLEDIVHDLRSALFPGYFCRRESPSGDLCEQTVRALAAVGEHLPVQIERGFSLAAPTRRRRETTDAILKSFFERLPAVQAVLATDAQAAYDGDPAATCIEEAIATYPGLLAITHYRLARELHLLGTPLVPRMITELAHARTGIDIHPGAQIGRSFFIDHGTGVVVGETAVVGDRVRMYQGVTLGALTFPLDAQGHPLKGQPRHPIVEDDVILYAGATLLGRITIGRGSIIGGGVWLTESVPPGTRLSMSSHLTKPPRKASS